MVKNLILIISSLGIFLTACQKPTKKFTIAADLNGFPENSRVIISNAITGKVLDSTKLVENRFVLTGFIQEQPTTLNIVIIPDNNEVVNSFIFIGNENVKISGNKSDF